MKKLTLFFTLLSGSVFATPPHPAPIENGDWILIALGLIALVILVVKAVKVKSY